MKTSLLQKGMKGLLGALMVMAAIGHFTFQRAEFQAQVPNWIPLSKDLVVLLSGVVELSLGLSMLFWTKKQVGVGIALATFYLLIFPGNIAQYMNGTNAFGLDTDAARLTRLFFQPVLILWALWSTGALKYLRKGGTDNPETSNFYDLSAVDISGKTIHMSDFKGKVVLIVNTATKCGLAPQFEGLEELHRKYGPQGLVVLGFPCSQFAHQELDDNQAIAQSCSLNFGVTFQLLAKTDVNGPQTHPVFVYLKNQLSGFPGKNIKWNFTKFLIDSNGKPVKRFSPTTKPQAIASYIETALKNSL